MFKEFKFGGHLQRQTNRGFYCDCEYGSIHHDAWEEAKPICWHLKLVIRAMNAKRVKITNNCNLCNKETIHLTSTMLDNFIFQLCDKCRTKVLKKEYNYEILL